MAAATMALSSCFAVAAGAPSHVVVGAGRAAVCFPRRRAVAVVVRAQSEPDVEPTEQQQEAAASSPATPSPAAKLPKAAKKPSTKLSDVLASGAVMSADAELWNGRFAMLGLAAPARLHRVPHRLAVRQRIN
uniref:Uncharacterized protein n=1 Tax=Oryza brachyantha TaxID=4533 RepID=J3MJ00_ORYBR